MKQSFSGTHSARNSFNGRGRGNATHFKNNRKPKRLDSALFVQKAQNKLQTEYVTKHSFDDFDISQAIKGSIKAVGYVLPTPIQDQCIPLVLSGRDVLGIADTGTGKSAAFIIPLAEKIHADTSQNVLIVAPTRELALQIESELRKFTRSLGLHTLACIGGENIARHIERLRRKPHFVVGTPGRLLDLEKRQAIFFSEYQSVVLDEVDRMLDMGFVKDITHIMSRLPEKRQSLFFSATLPKKIDSLVYSFMSNPAKIAVSENAPSTHVDQDIIRYKADNKLALLEDLLSQNHVEKSIVFGRTRWGIKKLTKHLGNKGYKVAEIHGNRSQSQRQAALDKFKKNFVNVLLATDVAARGIDVDDITHVINYDAPESYDDYIHRIGRTGRAGKKGTALTFVES